MAAWLLLLQAVTYFLRALKLNRNYLSAWTLMGHEYVEMKNIPAAIGKALKGCLLPPIRSTMLGARCWIALQEPACCACTQASRNCNWECH